MQERRVCGCSGPRGGHGPLAAGKRTKRGRVSGMKCSALINSGAWGLQVETQASWRMGAALWGAVRLVGRGVGRGGSPAASAQELFWAGVSPRW